jgi:hypothetical protein
LNKLKVIKNPTSIYTLWAPSSRKFLKKLPIYMWPMYAHVCPCTFMCELKLNWKWTKIQLKVNLNLIRSELKMN